MWRAAHHARAAAHRCARAATFARSFAASAAPASSTTSTSLPRLALVSLAGGLAGCLLSRLLASDDRELRQARQELARMRRERREAGEGEEEGEGEQAAKQKPGHAHVRNTQQEQKPPISYVAPNPEDDAEPQATAASAQRVESSKHALAPIPSEPATAPSTVATSSTFSASASSSSDASSEAEDGDDDDDDDDEAFAAWKASREQGFSAPVSPETGRPYVRNLVASELAERIEAREGDVLLQIYAPWCGACKMMAPIIDSVAEVLHEVESDGTPSSSAAPAPPPTQVYVMDGEANLAPGFLSDEENRALPLIKFFPRCGSRRTADEALRTSPACTPQVYQGRPNVQSLLDFVHARVAEEDAAESQAGSRVRPAFDLDRAHSVAARREARTHAAVEAALLKRFEADAADMPALRLHEIAPCGSHLTHLMRRFMLSGYTSYVPAAQDEAEGAAAFAAYRECTEREEEKLQEFWEQVKKQTDEALENMEKKRKQREEEKQQQQGSEANRAEVPQGSDTQKAE